MTDKSKTEVFVKNDVYKEYMDKLTSEDSKGSQMEKRVTVLSPEEVFSLPEPIRFGLLYGHLRSYPEGEKDKQSE